MRRPAVAMYAGEHKGAIPIAFRYPADGWPHGYHWFSHLAPYLQKGVSEDEIAASRDASVLWGCPQWEKDPRPWTDYGFHWGISWKIGYGYNALPRALQRPTPEPTDSMLINPVAAKGRYFKLSEIRHHSERGMVADATEILVCVYYPWDPTVPVERQQFSHLDPTRHGGWKQTGGCNVLFYDGHVSALSPRELYYAFGDPIRSDPP